MLFKLSIHCIQISLVNQLPYQYKATKESNETWKTVNHNWHNSDLFWCDFPVSGKGSVGSRVVLYVLQHGLDFQWNYYHCVWNCNQWIWDISVKALASHGDDRTFAII